MRQFEIQSYPSTGLGRVNRENGKTVADEIVEFCSEPRLCKEILEFLGMSAVYWINKAYLKPLIDDGRLRVTNPGDYASHNQRFVNTEYKINIPTQEAVLEYCRVPKTKTEIVTYFCLNNNRMKRIINPLIERGLLIGEDTNNPKNRWQKFVSHDSEFNKPKTERLEEFCQAPRTTREIAEHFGISIQHVRYFITPFMDSGHITLQKPDKQVGLYNKYVAAESKTERQPPCTAKRIWRS